ncbi:MAG TPA: class I SAM-dependent methyltransferase [Gaiella sp.]|jgi:SAM-dependent methyltransferase|nr:class I SAM-dependent methyltransferase [Gaiella sp.]
MGSEQTGSAEPQTWHHGLVATWWAEFNDDFRPHEIPYFRRHVERGEPALDVACGTGRVLIPCLRAGLDVDGCDVSDDMIERCGEKAAREGLTPTLFVQPMHELTPPRRYGTIFVCGAFGLGSTREQDAVALRRLHEVLEPGGTLLIDIEAPYADAKQWRYWTSDGRRALPEALPPPRERRLASDGAEYTLRGRVVDLDPLEQRVTLVMHAERWRDGALDAAEDRTLTINLYFRNELMLMLERAGFADARVEGDHNGRPATPDDEFLVFVARKES